LAAIAAPTTRCAGPVLDDEWLAERVRQMIGHEPRDLIGRSAYAKRAK